VYVRTKNKAEAIAVSIFEYNEEQHMAGIRKERYASGYENAVIQDILDLLEDYGEVSYNLKARLDSVKNMETLKKYHKIAARVSSMEEFLDRISNIKIASDENRVGDTAVSIFEYNEEQHMTGIRKEGYDSGYKNAIIRNILDFLEDYGEVPDDIKAKLEAVKDMETFKKYLKIAAKAGSVEEFFDKIK